MSEFVEYIETRMVDAMVQKLGVSQPVARMIMAEVVADICRDYGGQEPYICKGKRQEVNRDAVVKTFLDEGPPAVRERFGISRSALYRLLKKD